MKRTLTDEEIEQYAADAEPSLPWTAEASARLHKDARAVLLGHEISDKIENHYERRKFLQWVEHAERDLCLEMLEHGKCVGNGLHEWDDHLCVEVYEPKLRGRTITLPAGIKVFYRDKVTD